MTSRPRDFISAWMRLGTYQVGCFSMSTMRVSPIGAFQSEFDTPTG